VRFKGSLAKGLLIALAVALIPVTAVSAQKITPGSTCKVLNQKVVYQNKTYTCTKSGKKLVWNKGVPVKKSTPTFGPLWEKYSWDKPTSSLSVTSAATDKFKAYVAVTRSKDTVIKIAAQDGANQTLVGWLKDAANLVLKAFDYPKLSEPFLVVVAVDRAWVEKTYIENGWDKEWAKDLAVGMSAPGGAIGNKSNLYDSSLITRNNLLVNDKLGMMQMAGHEYFHSVQTSLAGEIADASGSKIPNWFLEGSAVFIGLQNASYFGWANYSTEGRKFALARSNAHPTKSSLLSEATKNNDTPEDADPYGIGAIATEFLVANVGMEKFMEVFKNLGKQEKFADAFKTATGVELTDFYTMFEEVRPILGIPRS